MMRTPLEVADVFRDGEDRFLMHTLPSGFVRIRYYGFLANRYRNERLEKCRDLLGVTVSTDNSDPRGSNTCGKL